jgi:glutathione S-transferase
MVLKLYGNPLSTCTQRVATVLHEKNVPFEIVSIDLSKGEHKRPEYLAKQPFGQVPYIDDDGFILYESRGISRYISTKYANQGNKLVPTDLKEYGLFEQAASTETYHFDVYASRAVFEGLFKARMGLQTDEAALKSNLATLDAKLDVYEGILSKQKYLAGDEITLADIFHLPYGSMLYSINQGYLLEKAERPHVNRWWKDITSRPSWQAVKDGVKSTA